MPHINADQLMPIEFWPIRADYSGTWLTPVTFLVQVIDCLDI
jgi:hypothetical protein